MARVLMIAYTTYVNDGRVKRHAQALAERGDHVDLICLENFQQGAHNGVNVIGLKQRRYRGSSRSSYMRSYMRFFAGAAMRACLMSLKRRYDVVIVCTMPDAAVICAIPLKLLGSKVVLDIHDTMPELYCEKFGGTRGAIGASVLRLEERVSTWFANRVLAVHELHRRRLVDAGVSSRKIRVVLNGPDPRIFVPSRNGHTPRKEFTVVCHGTVARRLGVDVAIEAMAILRDRLPDARLLLLGSGDYLPHAKRIVSSLNLEQRVRFLPPVTIEQLPEILSHAAIGLVPNHASDATHLMLPVKLLEFATLGIPVVAARLLTIGHYFPDASVRFFEPGNAVDLAAAIEELHASPCRRRELANNARAVMERINWERQRGRYYEAIDSLFENRAWSQAETAHLDAMPQLGVRHEKEEGRT